MNKLLFFITGDHYVVSHRLQLAVAARDAGYDVVILTRVRSSATIIRDAGLRIIPFELARTSLNPLTAVTTIARLIRVYRRERPRLVHHVAMKPILYGTIAALFAGRPRVINAFAGMGWIFTSRTWAARLVRPIVRAGLRLVLGTGYALVQNPDDAGLVARLGIAQSRIRIIRGSGVDLDRFHWRPEEDGVPTVLLASRLLWDKGIGEFVGAARLLRERGVAARFLIAGEPDLLNPAGIPDDQIQSWVHEGLVEYVGFVANMPELLARCHIACLPSYREGLPKSLIEAAASGRAIVTTDVPGCREVVRDGDNGLLVSARDTSGLADALERVILDSRLRMEMGRKGRDRMEREFGLDAVIAQTLALYRDVSA